MKSSGSLRGNNTKQNDHSPASRRCLKRSLTVFLDKPNEPGNHALYHYHFEIAAVNAMASAMSTATATATAAATATVSSLIISSSGLAPRSLRFVFLICYQMILSSHRSRSRLLPPPLLFRPQTKRLPADETPPRDHKGLFPFFIYRQIIYPAAHARVYSSPISLRRRNPAPRSLRFVFRF